jgi:hypothetical protein
MKKERRSFFRKTDIAVILVLVAVSAILWAVYSSAFSGRPAKAEIYCNSKLVMTVALTKGQERSFTIPQNKNVVFHLDKEGNIRFERSDCPDKICVHAGKLHIVGQSAACLPNGIILKIVPADGRREDDLDATG